MVNIDFESKPLSYHENIYHLFFSVNDFIELSLYDFQPCGSTIANH